MKTRKDNERADKTRGEGINEKEGRKKLKRLQLGRKAARKRRTKIISEEGG